MLPSHLFRDPNTWNPTFYVQDFFAYPTFTLKILGMCHTDFRPFLAKWLGWLSPFINRTIFLILAVFIGHVDILFIIEFHRTFRTGSLNEITSLITMIIICSFSFFNIAFYQLYHHKYIEMITLINEQFRRRSAYGVTCVTGEKTHLLCNRFVVIWTISCLCGTFQWVVFALVRGGHPLAVKYPALIDQTQSPWYELIFVMHIGCQYIIGGSFANAINVMFSVSVTICGQFDILFCSLKNVRNTAMLMDGTQLMELK